MSELLGEYRHKLDAKGRLSLPADFRKALSSDLKVTPDPKNQCLYVFETEEFNKWVLSLFESRGGYKTGDSTMVAQRKVLNSRAKKCEVDNSGRISLSQAQRDLVNLEKDVVVIGDDDHFEIWNAKRWDEFCAEVDVASLVM